MEMSLYLRNVRSATEDQEGAILEFLKRTQRSCFSVYGRKQIAMLYTSLPFLLDNIPKSSSPFCALFEIEVSIFKLCYAIGIDF